MPRLCRKLHEKYAGEAYRYKDDQKDLEYGSARTRSGSSAPRKKRADRYDLAEVFLEIGLVITSITLLSGRRIFWYLGILLWA